MREIVLDTETTGLRHEDGHRIVEIGCVELMHRIPTGREFQCYINPEQSMPWHAQQVNGLTDARLATEPVFADVIDGFLEFIGDAPLVAHNAAFDLGFLNAELQRAGRAPLDGDRMIDTLDLARKKYPGKQASLDALCKRLVIKDERVQHGALVDAQLLAKVYLHLMGGRQVTMDVSAERTIEVLDGISPAGWVARLVHPSDAELTAHRGFVAAMYDTLGGRKSAAAQPVLPVRQRWYRNEHNATR